MKVKILGPDDPALSAMKMVIDAREDIEAELYIVPWGEYRDCLMEALSAQQSPYHAVFLPGHVWIPELADAGYLATIDPLIEKSSIHLWEEYQPGDILPLASMEGSFQGHRYMLPIFSDGHILFYRQDLVSLDLENGVPLVSPEQLLDFVIKAHDPPGLFGLALKAHPSEILLDWLPYLWSMGGGLLDDQGSPVIDSSMGIDALDFYCRLREYCPPNTHEYGNAEIAQVLREGRAALVTTWGGQAAPIFLDKDNPYRELYRAAVFPKPWNATWGIAIPMNQSESVSLAIFGTLLALASTQVDNEVIRAAGSPVRKSSYSQANLKAYPWLEAQYEMLTRAQMLPVAAQTGQYLGALYSAVYAAFVGELSPRVALKQAAFGMREVIGK